VAAVSAIMNKTGFDLCLDFDRDDSVPHVFIDGSDSGDAVLGYHRRTGPG
jgi:hypothetical protein